MTAIHLGQHMRHVQRRARRAVYHGGAWVQIFARTGHATKAFAYGVAGVISILFALGRSDVSHHEPNVLQTMMREPAGWVLVGCIGAGLSIQGLWLFTEAVLDLRRKGSTWKARLARFGTMFRGGVHIGVATYVFMKLTGASHAGGGQATRDIARFFISFGVGRFGLGATGAGIVIYALVSMFGAWHVDLEDELELGKMSRARYRITTVVARLGLLARGVVFGLIGAFLFWAAVTANPHEAKGIGDVLLAVRDEPAGEVLLCLVGAGLVAYGAYELVRARYIRIDD